MGKTFNSFEALKSELQKQLRDATEEGINDSFKMAHENIDMFYNSPQGIYQRTGQLAESPEMSLSGGGDNYHGEIKLDTGFRYNPSGISTLAIYNLAESGGLLGNGGFWAKTEQDTQRCMNEAFAKRFN